MRLWKSFAGLMVLSIVMAGCAPKDEGQMNLITTDSIQKRAEQVLGATQEVLGDSGWTAHPTWVECEGQDGGLVRLLYFVERLEPTEDDLGALSEKVAAKWASIGLSARAELLSDRPDTYVVSDPPFQQGSNKDGTLTQLQFSGAFAGLQVLSSCVEGDLADLNSPGPTVTPPSSP